MPGFDGTGPMGIGPMTGGGRGFCSPRGRGAARTYGFPRWTGYAYPYYSPGPFVPSAASFAPQMTGEQEFDFLKNQAQAMRGQLEQIEARLQELESKSE